MKEIILFLFVAIHFIACKEGTGEKLLPGSNGRFNELLVVVNHKDWEGRIGSELKKVIASNVLGLPQPEPQFTIIQIPHKGFEGFLKNNRNILNVKKADTARFSIQYNVFSKPQTYVHINGPDQESIIDIIKDNSEKIVKVFKQTDLKREQKRLAKKSYKSNTVKTFVHRGFNLTVPTDYTLIDDTGNFVWFRKRIEHYGYKVNGSLNLIAYTLPLEVPFEQIKDSIISIRDRIGKKHIPGAIEGSYLITEAAYTPHIFDVTIGQRKAYKVKGKWEVYKDFMAGPFVNYTINDPKNKRLIVIEGFVYAPVIKKRDFMFEVEAILTSLSID